MEAISVRTLEASPYVWQRQADRNGAFDHIDMADERVQRRECELTQQILKTVRRFFQVSVVPEIAQPTAAQPRLLGIEFPRVHVKDCGLALNAVEPRDSPTRPAVREN